MTWRQAFTLIEIGYLLAVFLAFALYCAWVGPAALTSGAKR